MAINTLMTQKRISEVLPFSRNTVMKYVKSSKVKPVIATRYAKYDIYDVGEVLGMDHQVVKEYLDTYEKEHK